MEDWEDAAGEFYELENRDYPAPLDYELEIALAVAVEDGHYQIAA